MNKTFRKQEIKKCKKLFSEAKLLTATESKKIEKEMKEYKAKYGQQALSKKLRKELGI